MKIMSSQIIIPVVICLAKAVWKIGYKNKKPGFGKEFKFLFLFRTGKWSIILLSA